MSSKEIFRYLGVVFFGVLVTIFIYYFFSLKKSLTNRYKKAYINTYLNSINNYVSTVEWVNGSRFFTIYQDTTEYIINSKYGKEIIPSKTYIVKKENSFILIVNDSCKFNNKRDSPLFEEFNKVYR